MVATNTAVKQPERDLYNNPVLPSESAPAPSQTGAASGVAGGGAGTNRANIARIAANQESFSAEQLAAMRDFFASNVQPASEATQQALSSAGQAVGGLAERTAGLGETMVRDYGVNFRPVDTRLAADALNYSTKGHADRMAAQARADIGTQFGNAQAELSREMARRGVANAPGQALASARDLMLRKAAAAGAAGTQARTLADQIGFERLATAAARGGQIAGQGITANNAAAALQQARAQMAGQSSDQARTDLATQMAIGDNYLDNIQRPATNYAAVDAADRAVQSENAANKRDIFGTILGGAVRAFAPAPTTILSLRR